MAMCDYFKCDVCGDKAFYDANLSYDDDEKVSYGHGAKLGYVGDMKVICDDCSKSMRVDIVPIHSADVLAKEQAHLEEMYRMAFHEVLTLLKEAGMHPGMKKVAASFASGTTARGGLIIQPDRLLDLVAAMAELALEDRRPA